MSNRGGREHQHCLVGMKPPSSPLYKRRNKAKAKARKIEAVKEWQGFFRE